MSLDHCCLSLLCSRMVCHYIALCVCITLLVLATLKTMLYIHIAYCQLFYVCLYWTFFWFRCRQYYHNHLMISLNGKWKLNLYFLIVVCTWSRMEAVLYVLFVVVKVVSLAATSKNVARNITCLAYRLPNYHMVCMWRLLLVSCFNTRRDVSLYYHTVSFLHDLTFGVIALSCNLSALLLLSCFSRLPRGIRCTCLKN